MSFLDNEYREIITKSVCGKGKKFTKDEHTISPAHQPSSILGCWVINHLYNAKKKSEDTVEISGSYDVNIWYSYNDNTKTEVSTERVYYKDQIPLSVKDDNSISDEFDVLAKVLQQPNCLDCKIHGPKVIVEIEREFMVQVIGETKVAVRVDPRWEKMDDHDDDLYEHDVTDEELKGIKTDFLNRKD